MLIKFIDPYALGSTPAAITKIESLLGAEVSRASLGEHGQLESLQAEHRALLSVTGRLLDTLAKKRILSSSEILDVVFDYFPNSAQSCLIEEG